MARNKPSPLAPAQLLCLDPNGVNALIAFHRANFGDSMMTQPAEPGIAVGTSSTASSTFVAPPAPAPAAPKPPPSHAGFDFPDETPTADMTPEQRAEYWRFHSQKHEKAWRGLVGDVDPEEIRQALGGRISADALRALQDKATRHDALERELMSDKDKAVAEAAEKAKTDALTAVTPKLVRAEFKAALTGRVPADQLEERLTATVDALDLSKFLTTSGDVDTDKVTKFVDGIAPATGNGNDSTTRRGPSPTGHGKRGDSSTSGGSVASGRDLYREKHGRKSA